MNFQYLFFLLVFLRLCFGYSGLSSHEPSLPSHRLNRKASKLKDKDEDRQRKIRKKKKGKCTTCKEISVSSLVELSNSFSPPSLRLDNTREINSTEFVCYIIIRNRRFFSLVTCTKEWIERNYRYTHVRLLHINPFIPVLIVFLVRLS